LSHNLSFSIVGNRETLWTIPKSRGMNMSEEVLKFVDRYYSANIMRLVLFGPLSLDELQSQVEAKFSSLPDKNVNIPKIKSEPYGPNELPKWVEVASDWGIDHKMTITIPLYQNLTSSYNSNVSFIHIALPVIVLRS